MDENDLILTRELTCLEHHCFKDELPFNVLKDFRSTIGNKKIYGEDEVPKFHMSTKVFSIIIPIFPISTFVWYYKPAYTMEEYTAGIIERLMGNKETKTTVVIAPEICLYTAKGGVHLNHLLFEDIFTTGVTPPNNSKEYLVLQTKVAKRLKMKMSDAHVTLNELRKLGSFNKKGLAYMAYFVFLACFLLYVYYPLGVVYLLCWAFILWRAEHHSLKRLTIENLRGLLRR